jgi:phospholipase C
MKLKFHLRELRHRATACACIIGMLMSPIAASAQPAREGDDGKHQTETPIKHVIVLIGENRSFDHLFATYVSPSGDSVRNLLSEHIIKADGTPGKEFSKAAQFQAIPPFKTKYYISLSDDVKAPYVTLPPPSLNFSPSPVTGEPPPFPPVHRHAGAPRLLASCLLGSH